MGRFVQKTTRFPKTCHKSVIFCANCPNHWDSTYITNECYTRNDTFCDTFSENVSFFVQIAPTTEILLILLLSAVQKMTCFMTRSLKTCHFLYKSPQSLRFYLYYYWVLYKKWHVLWHVLSRNGTFYETFSENVSFFVQHSIVI